MGGLLRQATAGQSRMIGAFVSDSDFKTLQTGLTIANSDIKISANGGTSVNKNNGGGTHRANGRYSVTWDATDTATVGELSYSVLMSGCLIVWDTYIVLEEAVYDALYAAGATGYATAAALASMAAIMPSAAAGMPNGFAILDSLGRVKGDMVSISGDVGAADAAEAAFDGTGFNVGNGMIVPAPGALVEVAAMQPAVINAIRDAIGGKVTVPPTAAPSETATWDQILAWILAMSMNPMRQNSGLMTLRNRADSATIATGSASDDGSELRLGAMV